MTDNDLDLRYPTGKFKAPAPGSTSPADRAARIAAIKALPANLRKAVRGLSDAQLDTPYRPGGWTVRQVVHHVGDSHMNALIRVKLALTEDNPTVKPYDEAEWAKLADVKLPIEISLTLLDSVHARWAVILETITPADCARPFTHPEAGKHDIDWLLAQYAWHGKHHTAHVMGIREREGWG
jgi:hypothetical protein